jgi:hypothetical protein
MIPATWWQHAVRATVAEGRSSVYAAGGPVAGVYSLFQPPSDHPHFFLDIYIPRASALFGWESLESRSRSEWVGWSIGL